MKKLLLLPISIALFAGFFFTTGMKPEIRTSKKAAQSLGEFLYTVPIKKQEATVKAQTEWWHEYLEYPVNIKLLKPLLDKARRGEITVCKPEYPYKELMTKAELSAIMHPLDSFLVLYETDTGLPIEVYQRMKTDMSHEKIISITFHEEWFYNAESFTLNKKVKGILLHAVEDYNDYETAATALFYIPFRTDAKSNAGWQVKGITYDLNLDAVPFDARIYKSTVTLTDAAALSDEKKSAMSIVNSMKAYAKQKKAQVYDTLYPYNRLLGKDELLKRQNLIASANNIRFFEDWSLDPAAMCFEKNVRGIVLTKQELKLFPVTETDSMHYGYYSRCAYFPMNQSAPYTVPVNGNFTLDSFQTTQSFGANVPQGMDHLIPNADTAKLKKLAIVISDRVEKGKIPAYASWMNTNEYAGPWSTERKPMSSLALQPVFERYDTVQAENPETGDLKTSVLVTHINYDDYHGFSFYESWSFDPVKNTFVKSVKSMSLMQFKYSYYGDLRGIAPAFEIDPVPVTDPASIMQPEYLVQRGLFSSCRIDYCDVHGYEDYSGWNIGPSIMEFSGTYLDNIYPSQRYLFVQQVLNRIYAGQLQAYAPGTAGEKLSAEQLRAKIAGLSDSLHVRGDLGTDYALFNALTFEEDWYYNPETNQFYKKVRSITFETAAPDTIDDNYNHIHHQAPVFTIRLN